VSPTFADAELLGSFKPGSPAWHAARADGLGGSEIAAVMGLSPWESPYSLWHRKAGLIGPVPQTEPMVWGHRLEDDILEEFELRHPELLLTGSGTYRSLARPWQIANPDELAVGEFGNRFGIEVKTARVADDWGRPGSDDIPVYYRTQVIHYMDTLGLSQFYLPVLIGGSEYREYVIGYDPVDAGLMREAGEAFMASVAAGQVPDVDGHEATYRTAKELAVGVPGAGEAVEISPALAAAYDDARAAYAAAETAKRAASARILAAIGKARYAECGGSRVATRTVKADGTTHGLQPAKGSS
jgi:putative phage-type endonuclease